MGVGEFHPWLGSFQVAEAVHWVAAANLHQGEGVNRLQKCSDERFLRAGEAVRLQEEEVNDPLY